MLRLLSKHRRGQPAGRFNWSAWSLGLLLALAAAVTQSAELTTYYHTDLQGSPIAATDETGTLLWREQYRPFGERLRNEAADTGTPNSRWFTGHEEDANTGLVYMQGRYYDPRLGRFMAIDPAAVIDNIESQTSLFNRYAYANNNPYKFVDPDGNLPILVPIAIFVAKEVAAEIASQATGGLTDFLSVRRLAQKGAKQFSRRALSEGVESGNKEIGSKVAKNEGIPKPPTGRGKVDKSERDPKRFFTPKEREMKRAEQNHQCAVCSKDIDSSNSAGHHKKRHADGGPTNSENHAEVCVDCHKELHSK